MDIRRIRPDLRERGGTAVEYALVASLVTVFIAAVLVLVGPAVADLVGAATDLLP